MLREYLILKVFYTSLKYYYFCYLIAITMIFKLNILRSKKPESWLQEKTINLLFFQKKILCEELWYLFYFKNCIL